jgi:hypothetical protein
MILEFVKRKRVGLLFANQQLMAGENTARISTNASNDESTFRMDFARVVLKLSNLVFFFFERKLSNLVSDTL